MKKFFILLFLIISSLSYGCILPKYAKPGDYAITTDSTSFRIEYLFQKRIPCKVINKCCTDYEIIKYWCPLDANKRRDLNNFTKYKTRQEAFDVMKKYVREDLGWVRVEEYDL